MTIPYDTYRFTAANYRLLLQIIQTAALLIISLRLVCFIVSAVCMAKLAKQRGVANRFIAFIPLVNYILLGQLCGELKLASVNIKNIGVYLIVLPFAALGAAAIAAISMATGYFLSFGGGSIYLLLILSALAMTVVILAISIVYSIMHAAAYYTLYEQYYTGANSLALAILSTTVICAKEIALITLLRKSRRNQNDADYSTNTVKITNI